MGVSRSDGERASVLRLIGSKLCGGEIGQDLNVCCDNDAAPAATQKQEGFEFKVRIDEWFLSLIVIADLRLAFKLFFLLSLYTQYGL